MSAVVLPQSGPNQERAKGGGRREGHLVVGLLVVESSWTLLGELFLAPSTSQFCEGSWARIRAVGQVAASQRAPLPLSQDLAQAGVGRVPASGEMGRQENERGDTAGDEEDGLSGDGRRGSHDGGEDGGGEPNAAEIAKSMELVYSLAEFSAELEHEMPLGARDIVLVCDKNENGWWQGVVVWKGNEEKVGLPVRHRTLLEFDFDRPLCCPPASSPLPCLVLNRYAPPRSRCTSR